MNSQDTLQESSNPLVDALLKQISTTSPSQPIDNQSQQSDATTQNSKSQQAAISRVSKSQTPKLPATSGGAKNSSKVDDASTSNGNSRGAGKMGKKHKLGHDDDKELHLQHAAKGSNGTMDDPVTSKKSKKDKGKRKLSEVESVPEARDVQIATSFTEWSLPEDEPEAPVLGASLKKKNKKAKHRHVVDEEEDFIPNQTSTTPTINYSGQGGGHFGDMEEILKVEYDDTESHVIGSIKSKDQRMFDAKSVEIKALKLEVLNLENENGHALPGKSKERKAALNQVKQKEHELAVSQQKEKTKSQKGKEEKKRQGRAGKKKKKQAEKALKEKPEKKHKVNSRSSHSQTGDGDTTGNVGQASAASSDEMDPLAVEKVTDLPDGKVIESRKSKSNAKRKRGASVSDNAQKSLEDAQDTQLRQSPSPEPQRQSKKRKVDKSVDQISGSGASAEQAGSPPAHRIPANYEVRVGKLPRNIASEKLKQLFADFQPISASVVSRNKLPNGKGLGFLSFASEESQQKAASEMNGKWFEGRVIVVTIAALGPREAGNDSLDIDEAPVDASKTPQLSAEAEDVGKLRLGETLPAPCPFPLNSVAQKKDALLKTILKGSQQYQAATSPVRSPWPAGNVNPFGPLQTPAKPSVETPVRPPTSKSQVESPIPPPPKLKLTNNKATTPVIEQAEEEVVTNRQTRSTTERIKPVKDWEDTPGHIVSKDNEAEDIALSGTFISSKPKGAQLSGMIIDNLTVPPRSLRTISLDNDEVDGEVGDKSPLKLCCLVKGTVMVSLGDQKFSINEGGVWRIKHGEKCMVKNLERGDVDGVDNRAKIQVINDILLQLNGTGNMVEPLSTGGYEDETSKKMQVIR